MTDDVIIHTDGACSGNPGPGGWAAILRQHSQSQEIRGYTDNTTNNRMELTAVIESLKTLEKNSTVRIHTDSKYVKNGIETWITKWRVNGWRTAAGKPVKNRDLWCELDAMVSHHHITWHWVKGHGTNPDNLRADELARQAISEKTGGSLSL